MEVIIELNDLDLEFADAVNTTGHHITGFDRTGAGGCPHVEDIAGYKRKQ